MRQTRAMSDAAAPVDTARLPTPIRHARGVAMTAGLIMTPLMVLAGFWVDRAELAAIKAGVSDGVGTAALRPTIAPDAGRR